MRRRQGQLLLYVDGAIGNGAGATSLGALIRDEAGAILSMVNAVAGSMTCNEAEYAALILGLREASRWRPAHLRVYSDSRVVVDQMTGRAEVRSPRLRSRFREAADLARSLGPMTFHHIPRESNGLADALAVEALKGCVVRTQWR